MSSHVRVDLSMNEELEFTRYARGQNWAVTVDETQLRPHRCVAWTRNLADGPASVFASISELGWGINRQIKSLRVERCRTRQFLGKVVLWHAAIRRNAKISREQCGEGDRHWEPIVERFVRQGQTCNQPNDGQTKKNPGERKGVSSDNMKDRHQDCANNDKKECRGCCGQARQSLQYFG